MTGSGRGGEDGRCSSRVEHDPGSLAMVAKVCRIHSIRQAAQSAGDGWVVRNVERKDCCQMRLYQV